MKIKQNIGIINALIRITCGFTFLSWATAKMVKRPWNSGSYLLVAILSAMKIAEGIVRFCPLTALYQETQERIEANHHDGWNKEAESHNPDPLTSYNPS